MGKEKDPSADEVQREILAQQKFSMAGAIGRAGSGLMKGESPFSRQEQAIAVLTQWIDQQTTDPSGALKSILRRRVQSNELLLANHHAVAAGDATKTSINLLQGLILDLQHLGRASLNAHPAERALFHVDREFAGFVVQAVFNCHDPPAFQRPLLLLM